MKVLRRDDTEHGVDYVTLHEAQMVIEDATRELRDELNETKRQLSAIRDMLHSATAEGDSFRQALSGRTVSCSNCNALADENAAMKEVIKEAHDALSNIASIGREYYDMDMGPNGAESLAQSDYTLTKLQPYLK